MERAMKIPELRRWISRCCKIEFRYDGSKYSITYVEKSGSTIILLNNAKTACIQARSLHELLQADLNGESFKTIWLKLQLDDIYVYWWILKICCAIQNECFSWINKQTDAAFHPSTKCGVSLLLALLNASLHCLSLTRYYPVKIKQEEGTSDLLNDGSNVPSFGFNV